MWTSTGKQTYRVHHHCFEFGNKCGHLLVSRHTPIATYILSILTQRKKLVYKPKEISQVFKGIYMSFYHTTAKYSGLRTRDLQKLT